MHKLLLVLSVPAAGLLLAAGVPAQDDYSALLDEAIQAIDWEFSADWAYTETSLRDGKLWVGRHDPRNPEGWTLVSVDGRKPTAAEARDFRDDKADDRKSDEEDNRVTRIVEPDSLALREETDTHWVFDFVPFDEDEEILEQVDATLRIAKQGRYVESVDVRNRDEIRPGWGTKLTSFVTQLTFGPAADGGPVVPHSAKVHVAGRALFVIGFDEVESVEYSDFVFAGAR
jgi:hypothetical protein